MSNRLKDDVDKIMEYNLSLSARVYFLGSANEDVDGEEAGVNFLMTERAIKALHILESKAPMGDKPITIIMNNPGGDWYHGMAIYDHIKLCRNDVIMQATGYVMSMGAIILQAADTRLLTPNARVMLHYGTAGYYGHAKDYIRWGEEEQRAHNQIEEIFLEKIREKKPEFTKAKVKKLLEFDTIFNAEQAIEFGLADGIVGEYDYD